MRRLKKLIVGTRYERLNTQEHVTSSRSGLLSWQIVLKKHNFNDKVIQNLQNKIIIIQKLNLEITFIFTHEIEFIIISIYCWSIKLQFLQLHLNSKKFSCFCVNHLVSVFIKQENKLDFSNNFKNENNEFQLNIITDQLHSDKNSTEISIQLLWNQVTEKDQFATQVLIMLNNDTCYCSKILLTECEN